MTLLPISRLIQRPTTQGHSSYAKDENSRNSILRAISPASILASLAISRIVCIGTYSILCDFGADTSFYAYTGI